MVVHSKPTVGSEELEAIKEAISEGQLAGGRRCRELSRMIAAGFDGGYAMMTSSGTIALQLALRALLDKSLPDDAWNKGILKQPVEIIIPAYVCAAVVHAVHGIGAKPVLADINPITGNISPDSVQSVISPQTKAIIAAHLFGYPAEIERLSGFNIPVIEDCAQTLKARINGRQVGTTGEITIGSTYATKLICTGHGGFVYSKNQNLIEKIEDWLEYDKRDDAVQCYSASMSDLEAAMGIVQWKRLSEFISIRKEIADKYNKELKSLEEAEKLILPPGESEKIKPDWFRYVVKITSKPDGVIQKLNQMGIEAKRPVYKPLANILGIKPDQYPNSIKYWYEGISLPIYPDLKQAEQEKIISALKEVLR